MKPTLQDLIDMAYGAGKIIRAGYDQKHEITAKGVFDVVTEIDHRSEKFVMDAIRARFPEDYIITEESGELGSSRENIWYIDPLDGTINFSHAVPYFGVSIAYATGGELRFGAVYNPLLDELYTAELGKGAVLNGKPIHVTPETDLARCLFVVESSSESKDGRIGKEKMTAFRKSIQGIRRPGSCVLDLSYVASGRYAGFWTPHAYAWDFAAGGLIVREAGGLATAINGTQDFLKPPCSIVAAPPAIHSRILEALS